MLEWATYVPVSPVLDRETTDTKRAITRDPGGRIRELDGLRGVAILLVLIWHYLPGILNEAPPRVLALATSAIRFAWSGVDLFFVLSGFLIGGILLDHRESRNYFRTFYARRAYRILPVYAATIVAFVVLSHSRRLHAVSWLFDQPMPMWSYLTFTQNYAMARVGSFGAIWFGMTWSLAVEEQFYAVLPLVVWLVPRTILSLVLGLLALVAPITRSLLFVTDPHWSSACYMWMPARADALMLGVLASVALRRPDFQVIVGRQRGLVHGALALLALAIMVMALMHETVFSTRMALYGYSVLAAFYTVVLILAATAREGEAMSRLLRARPLRYAGTLAYSTYLIHLPLLGISSLLVRRQAMAGILGIVLTFLIAALSWRFFEKPLVLRGHRHRY
jgi:peptidoglycan/LPS O-acetylase OafA/YrhL